MRVWQILHIWLAFTIRLRWVWVCVANNVWCTFASVWCVLSKAKRNFVRLQRPVVKRCLVSLHAASSYVQLVLSSIYVCEYSVPSMQPASITRYEEDKQVQLIPVLKHILSVQESLHKYRFSPLLLDIALLCYPIRIRKDREVSQQCASSTDRSQGRFFVRYPAGPSALGKYLPSWREPCLQSSDVKAANTGLGRWDRLTNRKFAPCMQSLVHLNV